MNSTPHDTQHNPKEKHGTTWSYIIGFVLSLIFTFIPYNLVVNKTISGNAIIATILTFAVLQMLVQIFFFLHLGRGPKPLYNVVFFVSTVGIILVVVVGSIFIMNHLHYMVPTETVQYLAEKEGIHQVEGNETGACKEIGENHKVIIADNKALPTITTAHLCDTLTFINQDDVDREITFGTHPEHATYSGISELQLRNGRNKIITLNQAGTYQFHDHLDPRVSSTFVVSE